MNINKVKELCKMRGMTIYELEEACGLGKSSIYNWQRNNPSIDRVKAVADFFGVTIDYLLRKGDEEGNTVEVLFESRPEVKMLIDCTKDVPKEDILKVVNLIEAFKDK